MAKPTESTLPSHVQDALDKEFPRTWMFQEDGKQVVGTFVKLDEGMTRQYGACPIIVLNVDGEDRSVWMMHTALRSKLAQLRPAVGDTIAIKQGDPRTSKNDMEYYDYRVVNVTTEGEPDSAPDWDKIAPADDDTPF